MDHLSLLFAVNIIEFYFVTNGIILRDKSLSKKDSPYVTLNIVAPIIGSQGSANMK